MKHLKTVTIAILANIAVMAMAQDYPTVTNTNQSNNNSQSTVDNQPQTHTSQSEVRNLPKVQVNHAMLERFNEYQRNGSNMFLNYQLLKGFDYKTAKTIIDDYNTITTNKVSDSRLLSQK